MNKQKIAATINLSEDLSNKSPKDVKASTSNLKDSKSPEVVQTSSAGTSSGIDRKEGLGTFIAEHYNNSKNETPITRQQSRIFHLRAFNNWIKSVIISEFVQIAYQDNSVSPEGVRVLDIGCGKGGDLKKYLISNVGYLLCTDIAEESLKNCQERYAELKREQDRRHKPLYKADFIHADSTRERLVDRLPDPAIRFDLALMQFAFHYSFESLEQAQRLLKNASDCLRLGGHFVGTTVDSLQIIARARKQKSNELKNELFCIRLPPEVLDDDWKPPMFGLKYDFQLHECVDCPEFLVYFPIVIHLAARYGLRLLFVRNFVDFFKEKFESKRGLMVRMKGLKAYPFDNAESEHNKEFEHAKRYLDQHPLIRQKREKIGTMSASEWEIASLYCVFAFEKVSNQAINKN